MGFFANKRSAMNVFRLQQEWGGMLRQSGAVTRIEFKPIPRLAFGSAAVANRMVTVRDGSFVLEDTKGTFLPDTFELNGHVQLAPEAATGAEVWNAIIAHFRSQADSATQTDREGRRRALAEGEYFAWLLGDETLEREFIVARGKDLYDNPSDNPNDYDQIIKDAERLRLIRMVRHLRERQADAITRLALEDPQGKWTLEDARAKWRQVVADHKAAGMTEGLEDIGEKIRNLSLKILRG